jgi:hypothetical protein
VGLIVPVFGLALAPYWRSAGCRARHRARALGAALDRYVETGQAIREPEVNDDETGGRVILKTLSRNSITYLF